MIHRPFALAAAAIAAIACIGCQDGPPAVKPPEDPLKPAAKAEAQRMSVSCINDILSGRAAGGDKITRLKDFRAFGLHHDPKFIDGAVGGMPTYTLAVPFWLVGKDERSVWMGSKEKLIVKIATNDSGKSWSILESRVQEEGALSVWDQFLYWLGSMMMPALVALSPYGLSLLPMSLLLLLGCFGEGAGSLLLSICDFLGIVDALGDACARLLQRIHKICCALSLLVTILAAPRVANLSLDSYPSRETAAVCTTCFLVVMWVLNQWIVCSHAADDGLSRPRSRCSSSLLAGVAVMAVCRWADCGLSSLFGGGAIFLTLGLVFASRPATVQRKKRSAAMQIEGAAFELAAKMAVSDFVRTHDRYPDASEVQSLCREILEGHVAGSHQLNGAELRKAAVWLFNSIVSFLIGLGLLITGFLMNFR